MAGFELPDHPLAASFDGHDPTDNLSGLALGEAGGGFGLANVLADGGVVHLPSPEPEDKPREDGNGADNGDAKAD